jgi:hypothetical protein
MVFLVWYFEPQWMSPVYNLYNCGDIEKEKYKGVCMVKCGTGTFRDVASGVCVGKCPNNLVWQGDKCSLKCKDGSEVAADGTQCLALCVEGEKRNNKTNECEKKKDGFFAQKYDDFVTDSGVDDGQSIWRTRNVIIFIIILLSFLFWNRSWVKTQFSERFPGASDQMDDIMGKVLLTLRGTTDDDPLTQQQPPSNTNVGGGELQQLENKVEKEVEKNATPSLLSQITTKLVRKKKLTYKNIIGGSDENMNKSIKEWKKEYPKEAEKMEKKGIAIRDVIVQLANREDSINYERQMILLFKTKQTKYLKWFKKQMDGVDGEEEALKMIEQRFEHFNKINTETETWLKKLEEMPDSFMSERERKNLRWDFVQKRKLVEEFSNSIRPNWWEQKEKIVFEKKQRLGKNTTTDTYLIPTHRGFESDSIVSNILWDLDKNGNSKGVHAMNALEREFVRFRNVKYNVWKANVVVESDSAEKKSKKLFRKIKKGKKEYIVVSRKNLEDFFLNYVSGTPEIKAKKAQLIMDSWLTKV